MSSTTTSVVPVSGKNETASKRQNSTKLEHFVAEMEFKSVSGNQGLNPDTSNDFLCCLIFKCFRFPLQIPCHWKRRNWKIVHTPSVC